MLPKLEIAALDPTTIYRLIFVYLRPAAIRLILAHELGHSWQFETRSPLRGVAAEADADYFAGRIAERLGWHQGTDELIMRGIGCNTGPSCTHPSSWARVAAYRKGRADEANSSDAWSAWSW